MKKMFLGTLAVLMFAGVRPVRASENIEIIPDQAQRSWSETIAAAHRKFYQCFYDGLFIGIAAVAVYAKYLEWSGYKPQNNYDY